MALQNFSIKRLDGVPDDLGQYQGTVILVVNTASFCGFTPQFEGLEALYTRFKDKDFTILGFPCNQFGKQEPGTSEDIGDFCQKNYGVSFPMFEKINVNGPDMHPLYKWLKSESKGVLGTKAIKWNFTKFLIDRDGTVVKRYAPRMPPEYIAEDIETALGAV